ncbi:MAG TPA: hypothetical protein VHS58_04870 [Acetobacteraceae bacterium]|nr:hypothetical protein [Acetobacteraceae bacterium]
MGGSHFVHAGGQIRSLLSLFSYLAKGENRDRYLGVKIPSNDLLPDYREQAHAFASSLASSIGADSRK